ncbi:polymer-forming cytoskeletal protein [Verrucomicrobium sp. BvORR106]|uniref:polymer-forming cytoskeletal protein n=1 Tax=Verrucomicrobium sp. BvORR106 TaxID=1403819 RepID=UPI0009DFF178|nr:polymer-forming cytoskeletal protein [Verrucomicrobium sp. BvORR106]
MSQRLYKAMLGGFDPVLTGSEEMSARWTADLLLSLDWCRVVELARAMALFGGFELGSTTVRLDGAADFSMTRGKGGQAQRYRVRLAEWNQWQATVASVEQFAQALKKEKHRGTRGVFLAPGGFSTSALHLARQYQIETVDADILAARLNELPETHSTFFYETGTLGDYGTPTCPACMRRLELLPEPRPQSPGKVSALPDLSYRTSDIVAEVVAARRIEIHRNCEVYFLREVHARDVIVHGHAVGNFVCEGCLLLNPGSVVEGTVAARSVMVRPGAILNGETRILQSAPESLAQESPSVAWRCANRSPNVKLRAKCGQVMFRVH